MRKKLEAFLSSHLPRQPLVSDEEKYLSLISRVACIFAAMMHLFLLFFYFAINVLPLFLVYLCVSLIDVFLFSLVKKRRYLLFGLLFSATAIIHTFLSAIYMGTDNFLTVYLLVTLMMQIIIPYAKILVRALVIVVLWTGMIALTIIDRHMTPVYDLAEANTILRLFNIQLAFFGTLIQLTIGNIIRDVIAKSNREKLEKSNNEANTDPLTGLFNRRYADTFFNKLSADKLERAWYVAMLDIDGFKALNDTHGHLVGDSALVLISDFLKTSLRKTDLVFRWGGEEFLILLKDVDVPSAFRILDKLRVRLESEDLIANGKNLKITVTIGVCLLDIDNVERSIYKCDRLMYEGKASGKNMVVM